MVLEYTKKVVMIDTASTTAAATATGNVDTLEYAGGLCEIFVKMGTADTTSNNPSVFNLLESDDTVASNFATVSGYVGDSDFDIPTHSTAASNLSLFRVNLKGRKRYLRLAISPLTTQIIDAIASLGPGHETPVNAAKAGVGVLVNS